MSDNELITALRCTKNKNSRCNICEYPLWFKAGGLDYCDKARLEHDAADAIERLEAENAELKQYKQIAEVQNKKINGLETENAALREQLADKDRQIKQWENALSAFNDGVEPTKDVMDLLSNPDELKKWIARAAWHCRKVAEMNEEIEGLNAAIERRDNMLADQAKALSDLKERFDITNNFEQSQCAKLLVKVTEQSKCIDRLIAERDKAIKRTKQLCYLGYQGYCDTDSQPCDGCKTKWRGPQEETESALKEANWNG